MCSGVTVLVLYVSWGMGERRKRERGRKKVKVQYEEGIQIPLNAVHEKR